MIPWLRPALFSIIGFILLVASLQFLLGIMPRTIDRETTPAAYNLSYDTISFSTADGQTLAGWWIPAEQDTGKTVIAGHGYPTSKSDIIEMVNFLHKDYNLLLFDFRYFGDSTGSYTTIGHDEQQDVTAAIDYVKETHPDHSIALYGFSMSAATFIAANDRRVDAIIADSPYASLQQQLEQVYWLFPGPLKQPFVWTTALLARTFLGFWPAAVSPAATVTDQASPLLLIHGTADSNIPASNSRTIYQNANQSMTELMIVEGAGHVRSQHIEPERYRQTVRSFLNTHLSDGS